MPPADHQKHDTGQHRFSGAWSLLLGGALLAMVCGLAVLGCARVSADDVEAARQKIEGMPPQQKEELHRRYQQFMSLGPDERERIRRLHQELHADRQSRRLRGTMHRYHAWLGTLPAVTRYELRDLEPAERIKRIKELMARSRREPSPEDLAGLKRWVLDYGTKKRAEFIERIPQGRREQFAQFGENEQRWMVMRLLSHRWHSQGQPPPLDEADRAALYESLTPQTRAWIETRPAPEQARILSDWTRKAMWQKPPGNPPGDGPPAAVGERLDSFLANELSEEQRDRLLRLPPDEMQRELLALFLDKRDVSGGSTHHRGGPFSGGRPGGPGMGRPRRPGDPNQPPFRGPYRPSTERGPPGRGGRPPSDEPPVESGTGGPPSGP